MERDISNGLLYLQDYPKLWKWINRCPACGSLGHKPELPESLPQSAAPGNIRKYFPCMPLTENGLCEQCHQSTAVKPQSLNRDAPPESN